MLALRSVITLEAITIRSRRSVVQARSFVELLARAVRTYQNRAIETAQVVEELIGLAKHTLEAALQ